MAAGLHTSLGEGVPVHIVGTDVVGGGGGGPATIADGADVTQGAKVDAAWDGSAGSPSIVSLLKYLAAKDEAIRALLAASPAQQPFVAIIKSRTDASITSGTPVALWTPASGKKWRIYGYQFEAATSAQVIFKSNTTEVFRTAKLAGNAVVQQTFFPASVQGLANDDVLNLDVSATSNVGGYVFGVEV